MRTPEHHIKLMQDAVRKRISDACWEKVENAAKDGNCEVVILFDDHYSDYDWNILGYMTRDAHREGYYGYYVCWARINSGKGNWGWCAFARNPILKSSSNDGISDDVSASDISLSAGAAESMTGYYSDDSVDGDDGDSE